MTSAPLVVIVRRLTWLKRVSDLPPLSHADTREAEATRASNSASMLTISAATTASSLEFAFIGCQLFNDSANEVGLRY
jgi:hypothetical protein